MYCGKCGAEIKPGERFCGKCGQPITDNYNVGEKIAEVSKQGVTGISQLLKSIPRRALGCIVVATVAIIGIIYLFANSSIDPFEGVELEFSGKAPIGYADIIGTPKYSFINYDLDETNGLSNGDKVTLTAYVTGMSEEAFEKEYGKLPSKMEKEYTVEGLSEYISSYSDISKDFLEELKALGKDETKKDFEYSIGRTLPSTASFGDLDYYGWILFSYEPGDNFGYEGRGWNTLYLVYKTELSDSAGGLADFTIYGYTGFDDIVKDGDKFTYNEIMGMSGSGSFCTIPGLDNQIHGYLDPKDCFEQIGGFTRRSHVITGGDGFKGYEQ